MFVIQLYTYNNISRRLNNAFTINLLNNGFPNLVLGVCELCT